MTRAEAEQLITALGFAPNGQPESTPGNDSLYQPYLRGDDEKLWLGNAFVEIESQPDALDYRHENEAGLYCFIEGIEIPERSEDEPDESPVIILTCGCVFDGQVRCGLCDSCKQGCCVCPPEALAVMGGVFFQLKKLEALEASDTDAYRQIAAKFNDSLLLFNPERPRKDLIELPASNDGEKPKQLQPGNPPDWI